MAKILIGLRTHNPRLLALSEQACAYGYAACEYVQRLHIAVELFSALLLLGPVIWLLDKALEKLGV